MRVYISFWQISCHCFAYLRTSKVCASCCHQLVMLEPFANVLLVYISSSGSNCTEASRSVKSGSQDQPRAPGPPSADLPCGPRTVAQTSQWCELNSWPRLPRVSKSEHGLPNVTQKLDSDKQKKPFDVKLLINSQHQWPALRNAHPYLST